MSNMKVNVVAFIRFSVLLIGLAALGDRIAQTAHVPVAFAPVGWGGTSIANWQPNATSSPRSPGYLFTRLADRLKQLGDRGVRAVLWHQGESDTIANTGTYADQLRTLISHSQAEAVYPVDWFVSEDSYAGVDCPDTKPECIAARNTILHAQRSVVDNQTVFSGAHSDDLSDQFRRERGGAHFSDYGVAALADEWFNRLNAAYGYAPLRDQHAPTCNLELATSTTINIPHSVAWTSDRSVSSVSSSIFFNGDLLSGPVDRSSSGTVQDSQSTPGDYTYEYIVVDPQGDVGRCSAAISIAP